MGVRIKVLSQVTRWSENFIREASNITEIKPIGILNSCYFETKLQLFGKHVFTRKFIQPHSIQFDKIG